MLIIFSHKPEGIEEIIIDLAARKKSAFFIISVQFSLNLLVEVRKLYCLATNKTTERQRLFVINMMHLMFVLIVVLFWTAYTSNHRVSSAIFVCFGLSLGKTNSKQRLPDVELFTLIEFSCTF